MGNYDIKGYRAYNPDEEHWDIRWHKDSPCSKCKTFKCPEMNPFCNEYRKFLKQQLSIQKKKQKEIDNIIKKSYVYKQRVALEKAKDDSNAKPRRATRNNKKNKCDLRK